MRTDEKSLILQNMLGIRIDDGQKLINIYECLEVLDVYFSFRHFPFLPHTHSHLGALCATTTTNIYWILVFLGSARVYVCVKLNIIILDFSSYSYIYIIYMIIIYRNHECLFNWCVCTEEKNRIFTRTNIVERKRLSTDTYVYNVYTHPFTHTQHFIIVSSIHSHRHSHRYSHRHSHDTSQTKKSFHLNLDNDLPCFQRIDEQVANLWFWIGILSCRRFQKILHSFPFGLSWFDFPILFPDWVSWLKIHWFHIIYLYDSIYMYIYIWIFFLSYAKIKENFLLHAHK